MHYLEKGITINRNIKGNWYTKSFLNQHIKFQNLAFIFNNLLQFKAINQFDKNICIIDP